MKEKINFSCSMDCYDMCSLVADVENGRVVRISGNPDHPVTRGRVCLKGKKHLERMYHPERLTSPKKNIDGKWTDISWDAAIGEIADRLSEIRKKHGPQAVLHFNYDGYTGLTKKVDRMFFNYLGGASVYRGSLCWGAGIAAQKYDFGGVKCHHPHDVANARTIIIWGRNPANTNVHLLRYLNQARAAGAFIVHIDPIRTDTSRLADRHIACRPGTDGALALAMAHRIIETGNADQQYIDAHVHGFDEFREYARDFTPERAARITGVDKQTIEDLADAYCREKPACILAGVGMQRYQNGGATIRCIDALGAITGNIGISGGGVNYANTSNTGYVGGEVQKSEARAVHRRTFSIPRFGEFLEQADEPPVKCVFVTRANPLVQCPNLNRTVKAFDKIGFKVVIDMFMTDTARHADIVIPCTSVLEEEDIFISSMFTPYVNYSHRAVNPPDGVMGEYEFFRALAGRMDMVDYPRMGREEFLQQAVKPLTENLGIEFNELKHSRVILPGNEVPWSRGKFATPTGKYELYSDKAGADGHSPIPVYVEPGKGEPGYDLRLITPHARDSIHSQHFAFEDGIPTVYLNSGMLKKYSLADGREATLYSRHGKLRVRVQLDGRIGDDIAMIHQGWWHKSGSVNFLTEELLADMGGQAAYYDCFCRIE